MTDLSGKTFGQYRIVEKLGEGGMAAVYRAIQTSVDREVAIKLLKQAQTTKVPLGGGMDWRLLSKGDSAGHFCFSFFHLLFRSAKNSRRSFISYQQSNPRF